MMRRFIHPIATVVLTVSLLSAFACSKNQATSSPMESLSDLTAPAASQSNDPRPADTTRGPIYYVELNFWTAHVKAYLNGLPIYREKVPNSGFYNSGVNANLIGKDNVLRIRLEPMMIEKRAPVPGTDSMRLSTLEDADLYGSVKRYGPEEAVAGEGHGEVVAEFDLQEIVEQRRETLQQQFHEALQKASPQERVDLAEQEAERVTPTLPLEFEVTFDSEDAPSFRERLQDAPVILDQDEVVDYALSIINTLRNKQTDSFWREIDTKSGDFDKAYYKSQGYSWWRRQLEEKYYPSGVITEIERHHIRTRQFCSGRIWEVYIQPDEALAGYYPELSAGGQPLIATKAQNGRMYTLSIFVGSVDGELKVVR